MTAQEFVLLVAVTALPACNSLGGELTSTATPLGSWTFEPTRCTATPQSLVLSSRSSPLVYVALERAPSDEVGAADGARAPSILAPAGPAPLRLRILHLAARDGAPLDVSSSKCKVLAMNVEHAFSTRINHGPSVNSYSGTADIDCAAPDEAHRFVGHFEFTCPQR